MSITKDEIKKIYRYDKKEGHYHIDISLDNYRDVYHEWDYSPLRYRDLDEDLTEFLMDCSYEIPIKKKVVITFHLSKELENKTREDNSTKGIHHYFSYRIRSAKTEIKGYLRNTLSYATFGIGFLSLAYFVQVNLSDTFLHQVIPEGLLIGAWVLIWEIFSVIFFEISRVRKKIRHYKRLMAATIAFSYR